MMFYDILCSVVLFLCVFMICRYFNGFAGILFYIVYFIFCCIVLLFHGEATVMLYPTVIPVVIRMQRVGVLKFLRYFNLESLQNTGLNMPHKACFGHLRALDGATFSTIYFVGSPYLVVFNDLCFVFCSGQPFWVPWTCIL